LKKGSDVADAWCAVHFQEFANLSGLLMTRFGASGRTREKQTAMTGDDAPSIVGTVLKAVVGKR
jgi:hypothetical protein